MEQNFNKRYVGRFLIICIPVLIVMGFLPTPPIFNVVIMAGVAFYIGKLFAKDHARVPTVSEQNQFSVKAFVVLVSVVLLITGVLLMGLPPEDSAEFFAPFKEASISAMIFGALLAILMMWGSIHGGFSFGARQHMKKSGNEITKDV